MSASKNKGFVHKFYSDIMPMVYGFGAAIVIIGAMFKLLNLSGASVMLAAGLTTEAILFILGIFEPKHKEYDWAKAYPELAEEDSSTSISNTSNITSKKNRNRHSSDENFSISTKLDEIFEKANIDARLIERLGIGMNKIADYQDAATSFNDIALASNRYCEAINKASNSISTITTSQEKLSNVLSSVSELGAAGTNYNEKMSNLVTTLNSIDDVYKSELSKIRERMSILNNNYESASTSVNELQSIGESTIKFKKEMSSLSEKISALNSMYGNMLNVFKS